MIGPRSYRRRLIPLTQVATCSVLSGGNLAATRNFFDGSGPFACAIPEGLL